MPHRYLIKRFRRWFIYRVLHVDDTPHRIALGVAVGIFVTWTPTIGLQMLLCILISALVGANKFVGLPFVWLLLRPVHGELDELPDGGARHRAAAERYRARR